MYGFGFRCALKVERRINLVYGGGSVGLMGLVSQAVHDGGRHVIGFVSSSLYLSLPPHTHAIILVCHHYYSLDKQKTCLIFSMKNKTVLH